MPRFTVNRATGIGEDNYEVEAKLSSHIPEILPIAGRRLHVSYIGQLKQCKNCFNLGHIAATCETNKVDWLEYVATLHKSGKFKPELFDGWMPFLKLHHSDYKEPTLNQPVVPRSGLDLSNIARNSPVGWQGDIQHQWQNQGQSNNWQANYQRPRGRARGFARGNPRGRYQKRGNRGSSSNFLSAYN